MSRYGCQEHRSTAEYRQLQHVFIFSSATLSHIFLLVYQTLLSALIPTRVNQILISCYTFLIPPLSSLLKVSGTFMVLRCLFFTTVSYCSFCFGFKIPCCLLAKPVSLRLGFCYGCFWPSTKNFVPSAAAPFSIDCVYDAKASVLCPQCAGNNATCDPVCPLGSA